MEAKVGFMQKLRNMISGTPKDAPAPNVTPAAQDAPAPVAAAPEPILSPAEMIQDQARFLCSDLWLANQIMVKEEKRDGKTYLSASPANAAPFVRAAYAAKKDALPADVLLA